MKVHRFFNLFTNGFQCGVSVDLREEIPVFKNIGNTKITEKMCENKIFIDQYDVFVKNIVSVIWNKMTFKQQKLVQKIGFKTLM